MGRDVAGTYSWGVTGIQVTSLAYPKPVKRRTAKARKRREEAALIRVVRDFVAERDGYCRLQGHGLGACQGPSEWAHLEDLRRARTRSQAPERRHTTTHSLMLCAMHHKRYDAHTLGLAFITDAGADGPIQWYADQFVYTEGSR